QLRFAAVVSGRLKNKKQPAQPVFLAANLNPNSLPVLSPVGEGNKPQGLYLGGEGIRKDCHHSENALSPALPHRGGSGLRQIWRLQAV
ncbi:TPA: hypothetical protein ACKULM_002181, partial [Neisseria gonorrhoeae]